MWRINYLFCDLCERWVTAQGAWVLRSTCGRTVALFLLTAVGKKLKFHTTVAKE